MNEDPTTVRALRIALGEAVSSRGRLAERVSHLENLLVVARHRRALEVLASGGDRARVVSRGLDRRVARTLEHMGVIEWWEASVGDVRWWVTEKGEQMLEEVRGG